MTVLGRWVVSLAMVAGAGLVACSNDAAEDPYAPVCNGASGAGLYTEAVAGECPAHPVTLTGKAMEGDACSVSTDCAPTCCSCPAQGSTDVAVCSNGSCLDGATACCLYAMGCD